MGATVVLFAVGARRLIEGPGEDAGKGLLRIEAILQADIVDPLIGVAQTRAASSSFLSRI